MENYKKFLELLGLTTTQVNQIEKGELTLDEAFKAVRIKQQELLQGDAEFMKSIHDSARLEVYGRIDKSLKKTFGLSDEEIKELKTEEIVSFAKEKHFKELTEQYNGANDEKLLKDIENYKAVVSQRDQTIEEYKNVIIPKIKEEAEAGKDAYVKKLKLERLLESKYPTTMKSKLLVDNLLAEIQNGNYKLVEEKGELSLKNQDGSRVMTADKSKFIELHDFITSNLKEWDVQIRSNAGGGNGGGNGGNGGGNGGNGGGGQPRVIVDETGTVKKGLLGIGAIGERMKEYESQNA